MRAQGNSIVNAREAHGFGITWISAVARNHGVSRRAYTTAATLVFRFSRQKPFELLKVYCLTILSPRKVSWIEVARNSSFMASSVSAKR